jgi:predicted transcriptional regulator
MTNSGRSSGILVNKYTSKINPCFKNELIIYAKTEKRFRITQRGLHALDTYAKIDDLLVRKALHKMMNRSEYFTSFP